MTEICAGDTESYRGNISFFLNEQNHSAIFGNHRAPLQRLELFKRVKIGSKEGMFWSFQVVPTIFLMPKRCYDGYSYFGNARIAVLI